MCRLPSARQSVFVIAEDLFWRSVIDQGHLAPATPDLRHVFQQSSLAGLAAKAAQSLLDGALGRGRDVLAGELRQSPRQLLGLGILDAECHVRFLGSFLGIFYHQKSKSRTAPFGERK